MIIRFRAFLPNTSSFFFLCVIFWEKQVIQTIHAAFAPLTPMLNGISVFLTINNPYLLGHNQEIVKHQMVAKPMLISSYHYTKSRPGRCVVFNLVQHVQKVNDETRWSSTSKICRSRRRGLNDYLVQRTTVCIRYVVHLTQLMFPPDSSNASGASVIEYKKVRASSVRRGQVFQP